ncbi:DUF3450 domain-containing protein [uncultured Desulfobacter sp.]|uniref:DUF3450 domain-containing protein n=1 Tax=uncultured Desulfobacter sp. TaxID=240139 RepID=UPI002AAB4CA7|nr:DUF3450 domain-containing protein [uncultured Desulfobacter sp.]
MNTKAKYILLVALLVLASLSHGYAKTGAAVQKELAQAIKTESAAQAEADEWTGSKEDLVNEIRDLQTRLVWLQYQKSKHEIYVKGVQDNIADLEQRKLEARKLRENLEPYLEEVVAQLQAFIPKDLPFLVDERQRRLNFLKTTLNDYHLDLGEKLRRIFEALSVEATYGKMVTSSDETISIDGEETEVTVFRLGRLAMYYQSLDAKKLGMFNPKTGRWQVMDPVFSKDLRHALEMARRERTAQLIQLPLGAQ